MGQVSQPASLLDRFRNIETRINDLRRAILRAATRTDLDTVSSAVLNAAPRTDTNGAVIADADLAGGIARPYVPWTPMTAATAAAPPTTTSGSFAEMGRVHGTKQHPQVTVRVLTLTDSATAGEVRLTQAGGVIAGPTTIPVSSAQAYLTLTGAVAGSQMDPLTVLVEARRTSGAGTVGVAIAHAEGRES